MRPISQAVVVSALVAAQGCSTRAVIDLFPVEEEAEVDGTPSQAADDDVSEVAGSGGVGAASAQLDAGFVDIDAGRTGGGGSGGMGGDGGAASSGSSLLHRYSFSEPGTVAYDSVSAAHGSLAGGVVIPATGGVVLDGVDDFVSLPPGLISPLHNATLMIWATWLGSTPWQRLWDFGNTLTTPEMRVEADRTFFLTPRQDTAEYDGPAAYLEFRGPLQGVDFGHVYVITQAETPIAANVGHVFTVVVDEDSLTVALYIDGALMNTRSLQVGDAGVPFLLGDINDVNNSLGRSQYAVDPYLAAEINEFRIYDRALNADEVAMTYAAGADANPVP